MIFKLYFWFSSYWISFVKCNTSLKFISLMHTLIVKTHMHDCIVSFIIYLNINVKILKWSRNKLCYCQPRVLDCETVRAITHRNSFISRAGLSSFVSRSWSLSDVSRLTSWVFLHRRKIHCPVNRPVYCFDWCLAIGWVWIPDVIQKRGVINERLLIKLVITRPLSPVVQQNLRWDYRRHYHRHWMNQLSTVANVLELTKFYLQSNIRTLHVLDK